MRCVIGFNPDRGEPYIVINSAGQKISESHIATLVERGETIRPRIYFLADLVLDTDHVFEEVE